MKRLVYIWTMVMAALVVLMTACGTQKNTRATRAYHQMKVRYNIQYNGNVTYEEGLKAIRDANEDNYTEVLYLYPVSNHKAAQASTSQMDRTIEKCRKSIKLHSIKSKPKADPKRQQDPKYRAWLRQEEFNNQLSEAWIRLAEAEFHKGDFLGSVGTLNYVMRHYERDADVVARCQLLIARAYAELDWQYEAEEMLGRVQQDALSRKHAYLYAATSADVLLHAHQYRQALPYLKLAVPHEKRKVYRPRFEYVMAQIYQLQGQREEAIDAYKRVVKMAPPTVMEFHARVNMSELKGTTGIKQLRAMTHQSKYKDRLDQLYGAMGNIYLMSGDTAHALDCYHIAIDTATQATADKAAVLIRAADIHYARREYTRAQPYYQEASTILSAESALYARIRLRSEVLNDLIAEVNTVELQDSLQALSKLSDEEQRAIVDRIIRDLIAQEKADSVRQQQEERAAAHNDGPRSVNTTNMLGGSGAAGQWYFYNPQLMRQGKQEFQRKWGNRALEDNWRRSSKAVTGNREPETENRDEMAEDSLLAGDSVPQARPMEQETDIHQPGYYLQQIPRTEDELAASDSLIRQAMMQMVYIYRDRMQDTAMADATLQELSRRYMGHPSLVDLYYSYYLNALKTQDETAMQTYRQLIRTHYPDTEQARIVSSPDYFDALRRAVASQDSLYAQTYEAFSKGRFAEVKQNKQLAEERYPLSTLMPRFLFLNAVAVARTDGQQAFVSSLQDMVQRYPENALSAKAKDMLSMLGQGMESQKGGATSTLEEARRHDDETEAEAENKDQKRQWNDARNVPAVVLLLGVVDEEGYNALQFEVALFNFEMFMIRDFDLAKGTDNRKQITDNRKQITGNRQMYLKVGMFDSLDEAEWWMGLVRQNEQLAAYLQEHQIEMMAIAEENLPLWGKKE